MENLKKALKNFFRGKYSREEYFSIQNEFDKEQADEDFLFELEQQWDAITDEPVEGFHKQTIWNSVSSKLEFRQSGTGKTVHFFALLQRAAAILFIPLAIGFLIYFYATNSTEQEAAWAEIICPPGVRTQFHLPDGSTGVLNSESTLKYAVNFNSNRIVHLQGEAYFEVVKDKKHPFDVVTGAITVQVLGTSFSVLAYPDQDREKVVLKTGSVRVLDDNNQAVASLLPDQQFVLEKTERKYFTERVNAAALVSWIDGKLVIQNERFEDLAVRLSRWYHVEIEIKDQKLKDYKYYGTFENESLDDVLRLIALTAPIKYKEVDRKKLADGTFSNRKIVLEIDERRMSDF
ncbi:FecR family protein [Mangrovibacterium lignilyticum]|uniref:FecR family protein n=1 Tax=Mangrovibacterium lignilyticum TaxID=2668052 RepID=UPI0013D29443|nr:FecR domain-containing protein [Mangrovibacterium lignilyticum]